MVSALLFHVFWLHLAMFILDCTFLQQTGTFKFIYSWKFLFYSFYRYLKKAGHESIKKIISKREIRTTWTLFLVCFSYFLFVMPITLVNMIDDENRYPQYHLAFYCIYWLQYSLNFLIYVARCDNYRKAAFYFLRKVLIIPRRIKTRQSKLELFQVWKELTCKSDLSTTFVYVAQNDKVLYKAFA